MANEYEKEMLKGTKSVLELLQEEEQERIIETQQEKASYIEAVKTHEEIMKEYITKVKVIALYRLQYHPLSNPSTFSRNDKLRVQDEMKEVMKIPDQEITRIFNDIVCNRLFAPEADYSRYPIYR
jgi:hypothetical protein